MQGWAGTGCSRGLLDACARYNNNGAGWQCVLHLCMSFRNGASINICEPSWSLFLASLVREIKYWCRLWRWTQQTMEVIVGLMSGYYGFIHLENHCASLMLELTTTETSKSAIYRTLLRLMPIFSFADVNSGNMMDRELLKFGRSMICLIMSWLLQLLHMVKHRLRHLFFSAQWYFPFFNRKFNLAPGCICSLKLEYMYFHSLTISYLLCVVWSCWWLLWHFYGLMLFYIKQLNVLIFCDFMLCPTLIDQFIICISRFKFIRS
jgi:hypothetical protein